MQLADLIFPHKRAIRDDNQTLFAGRDKILGEAARAISTPSSSLVLFGEAGIGKTSLGWQLYRLLKGDKGLLDRGYLAESYQPSLDGFVCAWVQCTDRLVNINGLLLELLRPGRNESSTLNDMCPEAFTASAHDKLKRAYELNLGIVKATIQVERDSADLSKSAHRVGNGIDDQGEILHTFFEFLSDIKKRHKKKSIVIFIDEFNELPIRAGMGKLIKACNEASFVVIGTAETIGEIVEDHQSASRKLEGSKILVPPLDDDEMRQIFGNAASFQDVRSSDIRLEFSETFLKPVLQNSGGYPQLAHLFGNYALSPYQPMQQHAHVIFQEKDFIAAKTRLIEPKSQHDLMQAIRIGIGQSQNRDLILKALAKMDAGWVMEAELKRGLSLGAKKGYDNHVQTLESVGLVVRDDLGQRIRFRTPILRLLVAFLDEKPSGVQRRRN